MNSAADLAKTGGVNANLWSGLGMLAVAAAKDLTATPTSAEFFQGLWSIKDDLLGGLTPQPITFVANQPAHGRACWFNLVVKDGHWTTPDAFQAHCR